MSGSSGLTTLGIAAVLSVGLTAAAQVRDSAPVPAPQPSQTAALSGRVLDAVSGGSPVRRAIVTLASSTLPAGRSIVTSDDGAFTFDGLSPGDYTVQVSRAAFLKSAYGAARPGRAGTPIALSAGQRVTDLVVVLPRGSAIEGLLRDAAGDPAPGMRVEAIRLTRTATGERGERVGQAFTDDRGVYRLYGLPSGEYVLAATTAVVVGGLGEIGAPSEAEVDAIFADLQRRLAGLAQQAATPAKPDTPPVQLRGYSTPATYYPGTVSSIEAGRLSLGQSDDRIGVDFAMKLSNASTVSGTVSVLGGQSIPQITVQIRTWGPELPVFGGAMSSGPSVTFNRAESTFRIANVPPGRYRVIARSLNAPGNPTTSIASGGAAPPIGADGGPVLWAEADVQVTGADVPGIALALRPAPRMSGRISFAQGSAKPSTVTDVRLALEPSSSADVPSNGVTTPIAGRVRADGSFEFPAVIPGAYRLTAAGLAGWWPRSAQLASRDLLDEVLIVRTDDLSGVTVTMSDRRSGIQGALSTPAGTPASGYFVLAFPSAATLRRAPSRRVASTRPATNGNFDVDLPPGEYILTVLSDLDAADLADPAFLESISTAGVTVVVAEGERKTQNLRIGR